MIDEEWKCVVDFEGWYDVSNMGRVRSLDRICYGVNLPRRCDGKVLRPRINKVGYPQVALFRNGKGKTINVHRLVAIAFVPNPTDLPFVNHIDGVKSNSRFDNLEWVDDRANKQHAIDAGLITRFRKLLTLEEVAEIRVIGATMSQAKIAERYGCTQSNISLILRGIHHVGVS